MKPINKHESALRWNYYSPHNIWYNQDEGLRIAHKRWKRARSKLIRKYGKLIIYKEKRDLTKL